LQALQTRNKPACWQPMVQVRKPEMAQAMMTLIIIIIIIIIYYY
jgi:hypothetical protein